MTTLRIGAYASDPPALNAFQSFDPESFVAISMMHDALLHVDQDGTLQPSLAVRWERDSPVSAVFWLREGVTFHDGTPFSADDVVATMRAHIDPDAPSINGKGILSPIKAVEKLGPHRVRFETHFPDALFFHRMFFSQIYPAHILAEKGPAGVAENPVGTGAYKLVEWTRGERIVFERNPAHWAGEATVDRIELPIVPQTEWVACLESGELDVALNLDAHDARRLDQFDGLRVDHAPSTLSHHFLLAHKGPLADKRVRQALNMAVHRSLIAEVAEHGHGAPNAAALTPGQFGFNPELTPPAYDPERARRLLAEAGYPDGFTLRGLISSTSTAVFLAAREFLSRIGVTLEAEIVPRGTWMGRVVAAPMMGGAPFDGDFALTNVDNPTLNGIFHHFIFFFSQGPFSLVNDESYDQAFLQAATTLDPVEGEAALRALEARVQDDAMALFTVRQHVYVGARDGVELPLPKSGHFNTSTFWRIRATAAGARRAYTPTQAVPDDVDALLSATSHPGIYYRDERGDLSDPRMARLWRNLMSNQDRWFSQLSPMVRQLVDQVEAKNHLANVLGSTSRVGIVGMSALGRRIFVNDGYAAMVDADDTRCLEDLAVHGAGVTGWADIRAVVDAEGAWQGPVTLDVPTSSGPEDVSKRLFLSATRATNELGVAIGYTYVFSDFSGAEERIRSQAMRRIFDHVPYGLCTVDADGTVRPGYSRACDHFFDKSGDAIAGEPLTALFGMDARTAGNFMACFEQIVDDFLPEAVTVGQLPTKVKRPARGERPAQTVQLSASVLRDEQGAVSGVLFSMVDVTALEAAEAEIQRIKGAIAVASDKDQFAELATGYLKTTATLAALSGPRDASAEQQLRRDLHTYKGVFGFYDQNGLVHGIHEAEEHHPLRAADGEALHQGMLDLLADNRALWGIEPGAQRVHSVPDDALHALLDAVRGAGSLDAVVGAVSAFVANAKKHPAGALLGPLEQTVTRLAERVGKTVELHVQGKDVRVPESLTPAFHTLAHLVRNAIDHGLEPPEARGDKPVAGQLHVSIEDAGGETVVRLIDDGRGIDGDKLAEKAVARGVLSAQDAAKLTTQQKVELIFAAGLSTAEAVTDISGRGMGMDAVRDAVEAVGGELNVNSALGQGTAFELRLPHPSPSAAAARRRTA